MNFELNIIVAVAENGVIGGSNTLLWHISEDLRRFKQLTTGHPVMMGRKTYLSIGRPLPNRRNIVISRQTDLQIEGCEVFSSLEAAIAACREAGAEQAFVIGGGEVYRQALPLADRIHYTRVFRAYEGDTTFPELDPAEWQKVSEERFKRGEKYEYPYSFEIYERK